MDTTHNMDASHTLWGHAAAEGTYTAPAGPRAGAQCFRVALWGKPQLLINCVGLLYVCLAALL